MTAFEGALKWHDRQRAVGDHSAVLAEIPLFARLDKRQLGRIARHASIVDFLPGDVVLAAGDPADFFYVIVRGEAEAYGLTWKRRLGRGDYFGETALLGGTARTATVVANERLQLVRLPGPAFLKLAERTPGIALSMLKELGARARRGRPLQRAA